MVRTKQPILAQHNMTAEGGGATAVARRWADWDGEQCTFWLGGAGGVGVGRVGGRGGASE